MKNPNLQQLSLKMTTIISHDKVINKFIKKRLKRYDDQKNASSDFFFWVVVCWGGLQDQ
jgi:hypothetical protein